MRAINTCSTVRPASYSRRAVRTLCQAAQTAVTPPRMSFKSDPSFQFSPIINGCWQFAGGHGRDVFDNLDSKLKAHAAAGFTTFDTADIYGPSEKILGQFQKEWHSDPSKPRLQIFTKYVPNIFSGGSPTPAAVEASVRRSMAALQVDKLDLVQLHWWEYGVPGMVDTALALADCQAKGLIRFVATTNMNTAALSEIVDAGVDVVANHVQCSLLDRRPINGGMLKYCSDRGIKILAYGPVAGGLLSDKYIAEPKTSLFGKAQYPPVDLNTSSLKMYWNVAKYFGGQDLWRELLGVLRAVADRHPGTTVANVALKWIMMQGDGKTILPIVGMRGAEHIGDNAAALALQLTPQDLEEIAAVLAKSQGPKGDAYSFERGL